MNQNLKNTEQNFLLFKQTPHPEDVNDYYHTYNLPNVLNVIYWDNYFQIIKNVEGDLVECGIGRGRSLITILCLNLLYRNIHENWSREIYALDSFEGFPEPTEKDQSSRNPQKGEWSESPNKQFNYSLENLYRILNCAGLDHYLKDGFFENGLNIVKGFFDDTTKKLNTSKIAMLHLDGDLYESVKTPLVNLNSLVSVGGVIVIDDYKLQKENTIDAFPGARLAVEEFLNANKNFTVKESIRGTPYLLRNF